MKRAMQLIGDYEVFMPVLMIAFAVTYVVDVSRLPSVARRTPTVVGVFTIAALVTQLFRSLSDRKSDTGQTGRQGVIRKESLLILMMFLYVAGVSYVGYFSSSLVMLVAGMSLFGDRKPLRVVVISAAFLAAMYLLFGVAFRLRFPRGLLW